MIRWLAQPKLTNARERQTNEMTKRRRPDLGKRPDKIIRETAPLPTEPLETEGTTTGTVKFFKADKGWGCIEAEATAPWDIWVIFSAIDERGGILVEGENVVVDYVRRDHDSFKYTARRVRRTSSRDESA
jgi:cold shock CspA family protein